MDPVSILLGGVDLNAKTIENLVVGKYPDKNLSFRINLDLVQMTTFWFFF